MVGCLGLKAAVRGGDINSSWGAAGECCSLLSKCGSAGPGHPTAPHFWAQPHLPAQALPHPSVSFLLRSGWLRSAVPRRSIWGMSAWVYCLLKRKRIKRKAYLCCFLHHDEESFQISTSINSYYFCSVCSGKPSSSLYVCFCQGICQKTWILHSENWVTAIQRTMSIFFLAFRNLIYDKYF